MWTSGLLPSFANINASMLEELLIRQERDAAEETRKYLT